MKKGILRKIMIICILVCTFALFGLSVAALRNQDDPFFKWGQLEHGHQNEANTMAEPVPAITGEHFVINSDELDFLIEKQNLIDPNTAEAVAAETLIRKYSLYYQAEIAGVIVSDDYVDAVIDENIQIFSETSSDEYDAFLEGIEMTNEEYWNSCAEEIKITESIAAWKALQYDQFLAENGYDLTPPDDLAAQWETYYNQLESNIIEQENVQYHNTSSS